MFDHEMEIVAVDGFRCASVAWALAQAVPELTRVPAVSVMDSALQRGFILRDELESAHRLARGRRGVAKTHSWWREANGLSESPLETRARLECSDAGIPPDALQFVVVDADQRRRRADMAWMLADGTYLLVEIDGTEYHSDVQAIYRDRERHNSLVIGGGWPTLRFTAADLYQTGTVPATVRSAIRAYNARLRQEKSP
jgi:hypothetical protein